MRLNRLLLVIAAIVTLISMAPVAAEARQTGDEPSTEDAPAPAWSVEPAGAGERSWFVYQLSPGQSLRDSIAVENPTDEAITFDIYSVDAFTTEQDAAFALEEAGQRRDNVGAWVTLGVDELTIEPGRRAEIPFEITVPDDASPGDHAGGIVSAKTTPDEVVNAEGATVSLMRRIGARVYLRVEGPLEPSLAITELSVDKETPTLPIPGGKTTISYEVSNTGNVRLTGVALLELEGVLGHSIHEFPAEQLPELLPGSSIRVTAEHDGGIWPLDRVEARLTVRANDTTVTRTSTSWSISIGLVVGLVIVGLALLFWRWRRRRPVDDVDVSARPDPQPKPEEELVGA